MTWDLWGIGVRTADYKLFDPRTDPHYFDGLDYDPSDDDEDIHSDLVTSWVIGNGLARRKPHIQRGVEEGPAHPDAPLTDTERWMQNMGHEFAKRIHAAPPTEGYTYRGMTVSPDWVANARRKKSVTLPLSSIDYDHDYSSSYTSPRVTRRPGVGVLMRIEPGAKAYHLAESEHITHGDFDVHDLHYATPEESDQYGIDPHTTVMHVRQRSVPAPFGVPGPGERTAEWDEAAARQRLQEFLSKMQEQANGLQYVTPQPGKTLAVGPNWSGSVPEGHPSRIPRQAEQDDIHGYLDHDDDGHVNFVYTAPAMRGFGVGTKLLDHAGITDMAHASRFTSDGQKFHDALERKRTAASKYPEDGDNGHGHLNGKWQPGDTAHFEYHCWQAPASNDYDLWQRTQQPVKVLGQTDGDDVSDEAPTFDERLSEWAMPLTYHIRFGDGHEGVATEDELHTHPKHYDPRHEFHPRNRQDGLDTPMPGYHTAHRTAMPWYHNTDAELNPGDMLLPAAERGHKSEWGSRSTNAETGQSTPIYPHYDPHSVYLYNEHGDPGDYEDFGQHRYEVEPIGATRPDPEHESMRQQALEELAEVHGVSLDEAEGLLHEDDIGGMHSYVAPRARVIRKLNTAHRTAMPTPMPEGITFHYHPTDETTPPTIFAPAIEARHDGKTVGKLEWFGPHESNPNLPHGEINMVEVHPDYRRHNIATTMFDHARRIDPAVKHSPGKTGPGRAWAEYEQSRNKKARTMTAAVTVYTKPSCPQCDMTKKLLDRLGVEHSTVDVTADPEAHAYVTGLGYQAAPVVVVNGGERHWSGFRPDHLKELTND